MSTKIFNTRLQLKYDSWKNWYDNNPTLLAGEIAVVNVPAQTNESTGEVTQKPAILFKVGDGTTDFRTLDWASGLAADVYAWAKREKGLASEIIYKPEVKDEETGTVVTDAIYVNTAISSLETAVKTLEGIFSEEGEDGTVTGISDIIKNYIDTNLNKTDSAQTGKYVSAVSQSNGVISVERVDLPTYTLTTGDTNGTVKFNSENVAVKGLGSAAYAATTDFDAAGTGAAAAAAVLGTTADEAGTATVHGALKSAEAANTNANNRVLTSDFNSFKTTNTAAIEAAAKAGTDAAADVQDNLDDYIESNDAALDAVKTTAEAARTEEEVNAQIDAKITSLDLDNKYEAIGAETRAKSYVDQKFTEANLDQYTTEQEVKDIVDGVIAGAADSETYNSLTKLVDYIDKHGGDAANMAEAIETLEGQVEVIEGKPAYNITSTQISNWDNEVGAKALAETKTTTAEVKSQIEAYGYATTGYADEKASAAEENAKKYADGLIAGLDGNATATAEADGKVSVLTGVSQADGVISKASEVTLEKVATTGKLGDLVEDEVADKDTTDYVIFYCGTSEILTK